MRIAIYHNLPSGGGKRTLCEATRHLSSHHQLDVYTLSCADHDFADLRPHVANHEVFDFQPASLLKSPWGRLNQLLRSADLIRLNRLSRRIAQQIDGKNYDVVFVHPCQFANSPSILAYLRKTPSVFYCQEPLRILYEPMPERTYYGDTAGHRRLLNHIDPLPWLFCSLVKAIDRRNIKAAGTVLVNSRFMASVVNKIYDVDANACYHGVDINQFRPTSVERQHIVLSVGSLTPLKGFDSLIRAMAEYPSDRRPALVIASNFQNPLERSYLLQMAAQLGVELQLVGNVTDADLVRLYNQAKVVAYAPVREPFGLVPLEAMACTTPVVGVAEGGVPETVIEDSTGYLVSREPTLFAAAIHKLVENPALARQYGDSGRRHVVQNWTCDLAAARVERYLAEAASVRSDTRVKSTHMHPVPVSDRRGVS